jgi:betaine lipid synthase
VSTKIIGSPIGAPTISCTCHAQTRPQRQPTHTNHTNHIQSHPITSFGGPAYLLLVFIGVVLVVGVGFVTVPIVCFVFVSLCFAETMPGKVERAKEKAKEWLTPKKHDEARLRKKLLTPNDLNPVADFILSVVLICFSPMIWFFAQVHDKLMFKFLGKAYIYNVSWEDPRMDHRVFNLNEEDHIITIASAGCNVLDYIIEGAMVTAVDFNSCQIALTELKMVAICTVEHDVFFDIFSNSNMALLREVYPKLRPQLSSASREFWDDGIHSIKSFMYSGTSGQMAWILFRLLFPIFGLGFIRPLLVSGASKEEVTKALLDRAYGIRAIAWFMDNLMLRGGCCLAGVPERQMALGLHRPNNLAMVIERVFFKTDLVTDNYFYAGYFLGYYKQDNCPRYLKKEHYAKMRKHLMAGKLKLVHGTMLSAIENTTVPITVASLLDHMDWMTDSMITQEMTYLTKKMDPVRGKIYWRTFADNVHCAPLFWLNPDRVDDHDDRVGMYWTTWIAHLKDVDIAFEERTVTKQTKGLIANLVTGAKMVTFPLWKPLVASTLEAKGHAKDMESFYKYQKEGYDAFREGLLHARPALLEAMPLKKGGNMVWIDIGGGTARNLEYFSVDVIRKYFKSIVIVDISASLLEIAQNRINLMGVQDIVRVVEHDCTASSVFTVLPEAGSVDIITFSYSYSMIPDQKAALANAYKLLKPDGLVAIADFFLKGNYDDVLPPFSKSMRQLESRFHKWWFSMDHVHLLSDEQMEQAASDVNMVTIWDNRFRGEVPFLPFLQPYHGVYIMRKQQ